MTYYDETAEYWGDKRRKIINEGRLTARSVKIFADGSSLSFDYLIKQQMSSKLRLQVPCDPEERL